MLATICFILIILSIAYAYNMIMNFCKHEWETIKEVPMKITTKNHSYPYNETTTTYVSYHLKCKKCGKMHSKDMR